MKTTYTLLFTLLFAASLQATTITVVVNNGQWDVNSTWSLNRQPQNNDTIVIPSGYTVVLDQHVTLNNIYILIYGALRFDGGKLTLNSVCSILIQSGGRIIGTSNSEQIRLGGVFKYKGEEGDIIGPALANSVSGNGFIPLTLPVKFTGFYAKRSVGKNELTWITSEEVNNSHFDIQRSDDGINWKNIAVVFAAGNPGPINRYSYSDIYSVAGKIYYRLKQVDQDGRYAYSSIKTITDNEQASTANIYACAKQTIAVEFNEEVKGNLIVRIININGQALHEQLFRQSAGRIVIHIPNAIPGVYAVQVLNSDNTRTVKKVVL
jgi:hypothetical protein